jgi:hypothetical protein
MVQLRRSGGGERYVSQRARAPPGGYGGGSAAMAGRGQIMSALPLRPFGVPDQVWPPGVCEVCCDPVWSDALRDWEYVEGPGGPCGACRAPTIDVGGMPDLLDVVAVGAGAGRGSR